MFDVSISSSLRSKRIARGYTQSDLAMYTGLSQNSISSIERGEYGVSLKNALLIARALNCKIEDIWEIDDYRLVTECDMCYKPECVGCKLSDPDMYEAERERLNCLADYRFG